MLEFWEVTCLPHTCRVKNIIVVFLNSIWYVKPKAPGSYFIHLKENKRNIQRSSSCSLFFFHFETRNNFITVRTISHWNHLPRDVVKSPLLEAFRMQLDKVLDNLIDASFPTKVWSRWAFKAPSNLGYSVILWFIWYIRYVKDSKQGKKERDNKPCSGTYHYTSQICKNIHNILNYFQYS